MIESKKFECGGGQWVVMTYGDGKGSIATSDLRVGCPYCGTDQCYCSGSESAALSRAQHDAAIDGIETLVLAHASAGMDIGSTEYQEGLAATLKSVAEQFESFMDEDEDDEEDDEE